MSKVQNRTEGRIADLTAYLDIPRYRQDILNHLMFKWGVSEGTVSKLMQTALRQGDIAYKDRKYGRHHTS